MKSALLVGMGLVLVGGVVTPAVTPAAVDTASAAATGAAMPFDFDGDGFADMAVGVPGEDLGSTKDAGAVQVLYGSASGATDHDQFWHEGTAGVKGKVERKDRFGRALASGDFNRDGYADLAIGVYGERAGKGGANAGKVQVLYGSPAGLTATGDQVWHQGTKGIPGSNQRMDRFGDALAAGDFDGDGYSDLGISVPNETIGTKDRVGRVVVLRGSTGGLTASGVQSWTENSPGVATKARSYEYFGQDLAAGDVNGDGRDDLAISARYKTSARFGSSAVHLLVGSRRGLTATGGQHIKMPVLGLTGQWLTIRSLRLGDANADGRADLVIGSRVPDYVYVVALLHGHTNGFHPAVLGPAGQPGSDAVWPGYIKAALGDVTGDGLADLALAGYRESGAKFAVVVGRAKGLGDLVTWPTQSVGALNILPLSGPGHQWLLLGNKSMVHGGGAVTVLQATRAGAPGPATAWTQDSPRIKNRTESGDKFGLTIG